VPGERPLVWDGSVAVMTFPTEIDISNAAQLREDLLSALVQGASLVVADMSGTTFCDSAGVALLARVVRQAAESGSGLRVAASAPAVTRVLALTGIDKLIEIYPSVAAALGDSGDEIAHSDLS
jgi:anti-sigma B factor antagonist